MPEVNGITSIEGVPIEGTLSPASIEEMGESVGDLAGKATAIFPAGGCTSLDYGLPPSRPGVLLRTTNLTRIDDYPSEDMTITVEAGIRMAELSKVLAEKNQMLPIDCPDPELATLGGLLATNTSGPRRYEYGSLRDYVLGIDVIDALGRRVHGGGRVVKNVAGYDLMKFHTGALGTLGVIVQVTLKLKPLPESWLVVCCSLSPEEVEPVLDFITGSATRPVGIELSNQAAAGALSDLGVPSDCPWTLILLFEESIKTVEWQVETITRELSRLGMESLSTPSQENYQAILDRLTAWPVRTGLVTFKANLLPGRVLDFCRLAERELPGVEILSHAGSGIVGGAVPEDGLGVIAGALEMLREFAGKAAGSLVVTRCPTEWKQMLRVWGNPTGDWPIMQQLKRKLDPKDILNPGRFVTSQESLQTV